MSLLTNTTLKHFEASEFDCELDFFDSMGVYIELLVEGDYFHFTINETHTDNTYNLDVEETLLNALKLADKIYNETWEMQWN